MNNSNKILITNLKEELRQRKWSQEYLGGKADVSQERISNLLNGKTEPTLLLVDKIANALEMSTVDLLSEKSVQKEELEGYDFKQVGITFRKYGKIGKHAKISIQIPNLNQFRKQFTQFNYDQSNPKSGKPNSYTNYMEYLLQNYYDNFEEVLDPLDKSTVAELEKLQASTNFVDYNLKEKRFPNAALEAYKQFIEKKRL